VKDCPAVLLIDRDGPGPALCAVLPVRTRLACASDDSVAAVREKELLLATLNGDASPLAPWKQVADAWCALGLGIPSGKPGPVPAGLLGELADHVRTGRCALPAAVRQLFKAIQRPPRPPGSSTDARVPKCFHRRQFTRPDAGFGAVISNPTRTCRADNPGPRSGDGAAGIRPLRTVGPLSCPWRRTRNSFQLFLSELRLVRLSGRIGLVLP
jgi:hypothetical protein